MREMRVVPVVLAGGSGTRLWPLSRRHFPKQFLSLAGADSMLQQTLAFAAIAAAGQAPLVICGEDYRFLVADQAIGAGYQIDRLVLEPAGRGTAAAIAVAASLVATKDPEALILVLPADHAITDRIAFARAIAGAVPAAATGRLVTFGVVPTRPDTGYGYIQPGNTISGAGSVREIVRFLEKPDVETATRLVAEGCLWNAGIFLFKARAILEELERHAPETAAACRRSLERATVDADFLRLDPASFAAAPSQPIDRAVMEKTGFGAVASPPSGWNDVGSWASLWEMDHRDADGNVVLGPACLVDTRNAYVRSEGPLIGVIGLDDVIVVATEDAILVAARSCAQDVGRIVDRVDLLDEPHAVQSPGSDP